MRDSDEEPLAMAFERLGVVVLVLAGLGFFVVFWCAVFILWSLT